MINIKDATMMGRTIIEDGEGFNLDRTKFMTASEAGTCIRKQWYAKHGTPEQEQDWGFARRGKHGEVYMIESLRMTNAPLMFSGFDQVSISEGNISATPDGFLAYEDEWIGIEIKTIDPRTNRNNLPKENHVTQLKIAMAIGDRYYDNPGIKKGLLIYMDASNFDDIIQFEIDADPSILEKLTPRANKILKSKSADALDREGKKNGDCKYCPFTDICGVAAPEDTGRKKANRSSNLDGSAIRYMELKDNEEAIKTEKASLKEIISKELEKRKTGTITVGDISVVLEAVKGRTSLDKKAVKKAGIDLSPFEKTGASSTRLTLKRV
jgi:CRISPR/Cas system-associated exonuclease Cas4 (RecB family)